MLVRSIKEPIIFNFRDISNHNDFSLYLMCIVTGTRCSDNINLPYKLGSFFDMYFCRVSVVFGRLRELMFAVLIPMTGKWHLWQNNESLDKTGLVYMFFYYLYDLFTTDLFNYSPPSRNNYSFLTNTSSECLNGLHTVVLDFNYWYSQI